MTRMDGSENPDMNLVDQLIAFKAVFPWNHTLIGFFKELFGVSILL